MEIFTKINELPILDVLDSFNIGYKKVGGGYNIVKDDGKVDESFSICTRKNMTKDFGKSGVEGPVFDTIGRLHGFDTQDKDGQKATIDLFVSKGLVENNQQQKEFIKTYTPEELLENFPKLKLGGYKSDISSFLVNRGVNYDWIQKNQLKIGEIFTEIGFYENYFTTEKEIWKDEDGKWCNYEGDNSKQVPVFMFPCMDEYSNIIGLKLRRKDGKTIRNKKSYAPYGHKTGLLYPIGVDNEQSVIIVEGEMDYLILRLLGYKNVVANLGGVQSNRQQLKNLLFDIPKVICLYDIDAAGTKAKKDLAEIFGRQIHEIEFPIREDNKGIVLSDVNDFYNAGYNTKAKWDKLFLETKIIGEEQAKKGKHPFIVLRKHLKYYDIEYKKLYDKGPIADHLGIKPVDLVNMRKDGTIQTFEDLCYLEGGKPGHYNTLDMSTIIKHGGDAEAKIHPHIAHLINNICAGKKKNMEWVHKAILFKLTHINNVHVPALVLYGSGGSGKGSFLNLLSKIFGKENTLVGLGQKDLEGQFDAYQGQKLIVEYKEVSSGNKHNDKKNLDNIKSKIGEPTITINAKFENAREVDNIAWFQLSSNHAVPVQMDSKHSGNRRFTIIKTGNALDHTMAEEMNHKTFKDRQVIREYVNWLYETYPEVPDLTIFPALDNEEKRNLEEVCEGAANQFFEWVEERYPNITRISTSQKNILLDLYCNKTGEDRFDIKFKPGNFDLGLSHRYEKKAVRIGDKTPRGYLIKKTKFQLDLIPETVKQYFDNDKQLI